jgi:hypothetical protein
MEAAKMNAEHGNQKELQNRIVAIIGRKGSGKSTMLAERLKTVERLVVFDPLGEHSGPKGWLPNELSSLPELESFMLWNRKRGQFAAGYVPGDDLEEEVEGVARVLYQRGNLVFGIEEVPLICSPSYLPPVLGKLIRTGRHRQIDIVWTGQRASECARTLTSLTDEFVLFSQTEPLDLDAIGKRCGDEVARRVAGLGRHDFITWDVGARRLVEHLGSGTQSRMDAGESDGASIDARGSAQRPGSGPGAQIARRRLIL